MAAEPGMIGPAAYRPAEAARRMGISRSKLYVELEAGRITARKYGTATLILASEIQRWLEELPLWEPSCEPRERPLP